MPAHISRRCSSPARPRLLSRQLAGPERRDRLGSDASDRGGRFYFCDENARDVRKLHAREDVHAGLVIIVPQVLPVQQRELFALVLQELAGSPDLVNEVIEIAIEDGEALLTRYALPE